MHKSTPEQFKKNNFFSRGFQLLYDAILLISLIGLLPYWMLRVWRGQLSKIAIAQRLGLSLPDLSNESKVLWVHAVSLGETKAVSALVQTLYERDKQLCIVISNVTQTGHEEAKRALPFAHHIFLPYDFTPIVHYSLKRLRPNWIMLVETDYWPNLLRLARLYDIKRCIVNAKLSEKSFRRLLPLSRWLHHPASSL
ncbi:MAG: hypothetical protein KDK40_05715, partial [Chlamydiia bacterium]|nr:hypothetical protein [Chlamydiia bacterium]